jgi:Flp pilus assembly protein TadG
MFMRFKAPQAVAGIPAPARPATSLAALARRFGRDESGTVAMMFGLMVVPSVMMVGLAVDFGRMLSVRQQIQVIVDNAALAGARAAQVQSGNDQTVAQTVSKAYFDAQASKISHVAAPPKLVGPTLNGSTFKWTAETWVQTPFLSAAATPASGRNAAAQSGATGSCAGNGWFCRKVTNVATAVLQAGGNNNDMNIETSLMLDVTGSMDGSKIADLQLAAKDLIDIIVWNDQSKAYSRVALAPFADAVNVGTTLAPLVRGTVTSGTNPTTDVIGSGYQSFKFTRTGGGDTYTYKISPRCVTERTGTQRYTDVAPGSGQWVGRAYLDSSGGCTVVDTSDVEVNLLTPLSDDKTMLKRRIDKLNTGGSTAGQLGTAWAWYLLSPTWNTVLSNVSGAKAAAAYTDTKTKKIAVIMTDGDYNTEFWSGVQAKGSYSQRANYNANNGTAETQAPALCTAMKAKGIEVYAVGFQVSNTARTLLKGCATDNDHYYDATSGDALRQAFRDIALKISTLRLAPDTQ